MTEHRPWGVYVHVPFCRRRCPYCDFYFEVGHDKDARAAFVPRVLRELEARRDPTRPPAATLSLGGGTPSQLSLSALAALVDGVRAVVGLADDAEVSLEVNPEDIDTTVAAVDVDVARGLKAAGFTRVSVGLQSFQDPILTWLGRAHDGDGGRRAVAALVDAGLDVGVDLIVGVPGEGAARVDRDIEAAAALGVVHLSTYLLTVEPGTPLVQLIKRGARDDVDDDVQAGTYERVAGVALEHGFAQYEVSSFARPGHSSRHNRLYWQRGDYLGLGPGAHSFHVDDSGRAVRRHSSARLNTWSAAIEAGFDAENDVEELERAHAYREAVAFGLRDLGAGVSLPRLAALHQLRADDVDDKSVINAVDAALAAAIAVGDVVGGDADGDGPVYRLTAVGARFADRVARDVLTRS